MVAGVGRRKPREAPLELILIEGSADIYYMSCGPRKVLSVAAVVID